MFLMYGNHVLPLFFFQLTLSLLILSCRHKIGLFFLATPIIFSLIILFSPNPFYFYFSSFGSCFCLSLCPSVSGCFSLSLPLCFGF